MKKLLFAILLCAVAISSEIAGAGDLNFDAMPEMEGITEGAEEPEKSYQAAVGLGLAVLPDYEGSEDYEVFPCPYARVHWRSGRYVELVGVTLRANLVQEDIFKAGPLIRYDRGRDDVENDRVDAMRDVDDGIEVGGFVGIMVDQWEASFELAKEVADGHGGLLGTIKGGYKQLLDPETTMSLGASMTYADGDYMDSFFTIDAVDAARSGLKRYNADSGLKDIGLNGALTYRPNEKWSFVWASQCKWLLGDAKDSPVTDDVGSATQFMTAFILIRSF